MGYRDYSVAKGLIVDASGHGDFTTIQAAINAVSSSTSKDIAIRPGTYTENPIFPAGIGLSVTGLPVDAFGGNVIINGKCTFTGTGTINFSSIYFQTNSDFSISLTGSSAITVGLYGCFINCLNNTGINFSNSISSSGISMNTCGANLATTGVALFTKSSPGDLAIVYTGINNTGGSTTPSTSSAGIVNIEYCNFIHNVSASGTALTGILNSNVDVGALNTTAFTSSGTGTHIIRFSYLASGTASTAVIGAGTNLVAYNASFSSSNTNVLTGAGALSYALLSFPGGSSGQNVSTVNSIPTLL